MSLLGGGVRFDRSRRGARSMGRAGELPINAEKLAAASQTWERWRTHTRHPRRRDDCYRLRDLTKTLVRKMQHRPAPERTCTSRTAAELRSESAAR
jgi:hypothetical protein